MVKNLTCRNENTNRKTRDYNLCFACVSFNCWLLEVAEEWRRRRKMNLHWSTSSRASRFQFLLLRSYFAGINENISVLCQHKKYYWRVKTTTKAQRRQRSEQQNRRKFLFILFVIISFLHFEYLRLISSLFLYIFVHFILTQKKKSEREAAEEKL